MSALADFRALVEAPGGPETPETIAAALASATRARCKEVGLTGAEIDAWGPVVTMILSKESTWEAVAVSPDDFQLYRGKRKPDGAIQWANVWTASYLALAAFIDELAEKIDAAAGAKFHADPSAGVIGS